MTTAKDFANLYALVVDDDKLACELIAEALEIAGLFKGIIVAQSGTEAISKLGKQKFGIIILDQYMPKCTGIEVIKHLRETGIDKQALNRKTPIIILSGKMDDLLIEEAKALGVDHFLGKPFVIENFIEVVIRSLNL